MRALTVCSSGLKRSAAAAARDERSAASGDAAGSIFLRGEKKALSRSANARRRRRNDAIRLHGSGDRASGGDFPRPGGRERKKKKTRTSAIYLLAARLAKHAFAVTPKRRQTLSTQREKWRPVLPAAPLYARVRPFLRFLRRIKAFITIIFSKISH